MRCILHIGIEKTGTTTLQEFFFQNKDLLSKSGYHYLETPGLKNHRKLPALFYEDKLIDNFRRSNNLVDLENFTKWKKIFEKEVSNEILSVSSEIHTVIISSEYFQSRLASSKSLKKLSIFLRKYFSDINIYLYLRRQDKVATSLYSTALKSGKVNHEIFPNVQAKSHYYNYNFLLKKWNKFFTDKEIHCRVYDRKLLVNNDITSDFIEFASLKLLASPQVPKSKNEKLDIHTMGILEVFNRHFSKNKNLSTHNINKLRVELINSFQKNSKELVYFHPLRKDAVLFYNQFRNSNLKLSKNWFDSNEIVFDDDFSFYPTESPYNIQFNSHDLGLIFKSFCLFLEKSTL